MLGEHSREVLTELGYTADEIEGLRERGRHALARLIVALEPTQRISPRCTTYHWPRHEMSDVTGIELVCPFSV